MGFENIKHKIITGLIEAYRILRQITMQGEQRETSVCSPCENFLLLATQFLRIRNRFRRRRKNDTVQKRWKKSGNVAAGIRGTWDGVIFYCPGRLTALEYRAWRNDRYSSAVVNLDCGTSLSFPRHKILTDRCFTLFLTVDPLGRSVATTLVQKYPLHLTESFSSSFLFYQK